MTMLFADGFDAYAGASSLLTGNRWAAASTLSFSTTNGKRGGGCISMGNASEAIKSFGSVATTIIVGFWWFTNGTPSATRTLLRFGKAASAAGNAQCALRMNTSRQLLFTNDDAGTTLATGTTALALNTWYFIEAKVTADNAGSFEVKIDGATEISGSGVDTQAEAAAGVDFLTWPSWGTDATKRLDDIYVADATGSAPEVTDFIGPIYIDQLLPTGDNSVQGTPSTGSDNYAMVDEATNNGDTDYVSFAASGIDLYDMDTLVDTPSNIFAVQVIGNFRRDDATAVTARNKLKSGATTSDGADRTTGTSYEWWADIFQADPDTSAAWTQSAINALIAGVERV